MSQISEREVVNAMHNDRDRARYYRRLCYKHSCQEFDKLPNTRRHEASWWVTCEPEICEVCNAPPPPTRLQELTLYYRDEANWPPMNDITRRLWRIMSPERRAREILAPAVYHHDSPRDGMTENDPKAAYNL